MLNHKFTNKSFMASDDPNPMDGVSNMSDAMLVLAVGIMLALVINWKIDIGQYNSSLKINTQNMEEVDVTDPKISKEVPISELDSEYIEAGKVYKDTKTGKTYIVVDK